MPSESRTGHTETASDGIPVRRRGQYAQMEKDPYRKVRAFIWGG
ncbi:hypothetical protein [Neisseria polysaccharea]